MEWEARVVRYENEPQLRLQFVSSHPCLPQPILTLNPTTTTTTTDNERVGHIHDLTTTKYGTATTSGPNDEGHRK